MNQFKINSDFAHKLEVDRLLMVSTDSERNEVYEFDGKASLLLLKLIESDSSFTLNDTQKICLDLKASPDDLSTLWQLCLDEKIIIPHA